MMAGADKIKKTGRQDSNLSISFPANTDPKPTPISRKEPVTSPAFMARLFFGDSFAVTAMAGAND
jgi:hypothetical protein